MLYLSPSSETKCGLMFWSQVFVQIGGLLCLSQPSHCRWSNIWSTCGKLEIWGGSCNWGTIIPLIFQQEAWSNSIQHNFPYLDQSQHRIFSCKPKMFTASWRKQKSQLLRKKIKPFLSCYFSAMISNCSDVRVHRKDSYSKSWLLNCRLFKKRLKLIPLWACAIVPWWLSQKRPESSNKE